MSLIKVPQTNSTSFWQRSEILLCFYQHLSIMNWSDEDPFVYLNYDSILITSILNQHADATYAACMTLPLPPASENFWKYCASFLFEAWKAEGSSSFINRIQNRLHNNNPKDLLRTFAVIANHGHMILSLKKISITHFERKNSRPDISILTAYEITPTTILKHVFHETTHKEGYIRIIILKVSA